MRKLDTRLVFGLLLVAAGVFYLLQTLGLIVLGPLVWAISAGLAGLVFLVIAARDRAQWWAWIPSLTLLGLAGLEGLQYAAPTAADQWGGSIFLGAIGLSFWIVYLVDRAHWWAIIPGGVLVTLAVVAALDKAADGVSGGAFFLGLGLTFLLVAFAPNPHGRMRWGFIPAAVMLVFGVLLIVGFTDALRFAAPAGLILAGGFLLLRAFRPRAVRAAPQSSEDLKKS